MTKTVEIRVEGGIIQDIKLPKGVRVVYFDYDVKDLDDHRITQDQNGRDCFKFTWNKH